MAEPQLHEHAAGLTWVVGDTLTRTSHALVADGRVWLVDPVDTPAALTRAAALGAPAGVIQLLDRHERDGQAIADRLGVPLHRLPARLPGTPFEAVSLVSVPGWREVALWWPEQRALVVAEAVGTNRMFAVGGGRVGVHPMLRAFGVGRLRRFEPDLLLVGHGAPVVGPQATADLRQGLDRSRSDLPRLLTRLPSLLRGA
jgi:hypothetical protein